MTDTVGEQLNDCLPHFYKVKSKELRKKNGGLLVSVLYYMYVSAWSAEGTKLEI